MNVPRTFVLTVNRNIPQFEETAAHLNAIGIKWEPFYCLDNQICRLQALDTFDVNRVGERLGPKQVVASLSHYMLWKTMSYLPEDSFLALEYDCQFVDDWQSKYDEAMSVLPDDWDVLFVGNCCCKGRPTKHIGKNLYEVLHPLCGHAMAYRKKALPVLLEEQQKIHAPLDISLMMRALPKLRVYTILPRVITQRHTPLPD